MNSGAVEREHKTNDNWKYFYYWKGYINIMLLHGDYIHIDDEQDFFLFWGEGGNTVYKRRGRKAKNAFPIYPGLVLPEEVRDIISLDTNEIESKGNVRQAAIFKLESQKPGEGKDTMILPYEINGITLSPWATFYLLINIEDITSQQSDIELSPRLVYWSQTSKLLAELMVKHRYYPAMVNENGILYSHWNVVIDRAEDVERFNILKDGMPPECRLVFSTMLSAEDFKCFESGDLLERFMNWLLDNIVRDILSTNPDIKIYSEFGSDAERAWMLSLDKDYSCSVPAPTKRDAEAIFESYETWINPLKATLRRQPFRTCFRITPPEGRQKQWRLDYLLQARDDPSLIVSAQEIWKGSTSAFLKKEFDRPQERLLEDLAVASKMFDPILKSLYSANPTGCLLSMEEAYNFLKEGAVLLEESGFGILAPSWWKKPTPISVRLKVKTAGKAEGHISKGRLSLDTILEYDWKASIGDVVISEEDFRKLAKLKVPLVRVRGEWVQLDPSQIRMLDEMWHSKSWKDNKTLGDILRMGLGHEDLVPGIPVDNLSADDELAEFIRSLSNADRLEELPAPSEFNGILRPYQVRGFSWLVFLRSHGIGACLADDMGLGKTIQVICLLLHEREKDMTDKPTLLICPTSVAGNWVKELNRFAPTIKVMLHHGQGRKTGDDFVEEALKHDVVISTYSLTHRDEQDFNNVNWAGIVLDEAQNIKNTSSKQTQAVKRIRAGYRIALTGTPIENGLSELWSIMDFLNPKYLGSAKYFKKEYAIPIEKDKDVKKGKKLQSIIAPFVLRRLKTDPNIIKDLPEKIETKVYCNLTREQATLYEAVVQDMLERIEESEGIERKGMVLAALSKLKQICNHPAQFIKDDILVKNDRVSWKDFLEYLKRF